MRTALTFPGELWLLQSSGGGTAHAQGPGPQGPCLLRVGLWPAGSLDGTPHSPHQPLDVCRSCRQLMAQEPLEKLGFGDLMDGKADKQ